MSSIRTNTYEGQYFEDKKHGQGIFEWESGNVYNGAYYDDERQGYGVMTWTDGSTYMGTWDQGIQQGIGLMVFADGSKRGGIFEQNLFVRSIKSTQDIDPFRDILSEECIEELTKIAEEYQDKLQEKKELMRQ